MNDLSLMTHKPMLYVCNVDEQSITSGNNFSNLLQEKNHKEDKKTVLVSAAVESQIAQFDNTKDKLEFLNEFSNF